MTSDFIPVNDLVKRDIKDFYDLYQFQSSKNESKCNIVYIGTYKQIPIIPIFEKKIKKFLCTLVSFVVSEKEINQNECNLIGFLISSEKNVKASLVLSFVPKNEIIVDKKNITDVDGVFEVNMLTRQNGNNIKKNIRTYDKYLGREEFIYELAQLLIENI